MTENIKIEVYRGVKAFKEIGDCWNSIEINQYFSIYSKHEWFLAWLETYGENIKLVTIVARNDKEFLGFLPVCRRRSNKHGLFFRITEPLSGSYPDYHCPVIKEGWENIVLPIMLKKLWEIINFSGTFIWPNISEANPGVNIIRNSIKNNSFLYTESYGTCPRISFNNDYHLTEAAWRKNHRTDVRRQRRRLSEIGPLTLWFPKTKEEVESFLPEFFEVYNEKWLSQNKPSKFNNRLKKQHFQKIVEHMWDKGLHISTLKVNNLSVSYHFGFISKGWLLWYMPTYRVEYEKQSPTKVHISYLIEHGIQGGWKGIDFLQGNEFYKTEWSNGSIRTVTFTIGFNKYSPSYFWFSKGKNFIKSKIGKFYMKLGAFKQKFLSLKIR
jgi:CelD/BcsL family acetyltransferase involved in cellulose biosynthesis